MTERLRGNLVVFAGALYDAPLWTNRQHVSTRLAARGWRVLYVEPRLHLLGPCLGRVAMTRGWWRWLARHLIPWSPTPNLWVIAQSNLLWRSRLVPWRGRVNGALNSWRVRLLARLLGFRDSSVLIYDTEAAPYTRVFTKSRIVYDCVDDHRVQAGVDRNPKLVALEEGILVSRASAIAVTTRPLFERFSRVHAQVRLVPQAADVQAFSAPPPPEPEDMARVPHPRVGTVGALDAYKFDVPLLAALIEQHPQWQFVFVGPVEYGQWAVGSRQWAVGSGQGVRVLRRYPNVHFLGSKSRGDVPAYVHAFDVALIPYRDSAYNRSSFPLKFWEFLAAGKPVVASGLPSLEPYRHLATLATTPEGFADGIALALATPEQGRSERVAEARTHDWSTRVAALEQLLLSDSVSV